MHTPNRSETFQKYRDQTSEHNSNQKERGVFKNQFVREVSEEQPPSMNTTVKHNQNKVIFNQQEEIQYWKNKYGELQQHSNKQDEDINYLNIVLQNYQNLQESTIKGNDTKLLQTDNTLNLEQPKDKEDKDYQIRNLQAQCADYFKTIQEFQQAADQQKQTLYEQVDNLKNWNVTSQNQRIQFLQKIQLLMSPLTP